MKKFRLITASLLMIATVGTLHAGNTKKVSCDSGYDLEDRGAHKFRCKKEKFKGRNARHDAGCADMWEHQKIAGRDQCQKPFSPGVKRDAQCFSLVPIDGNLKYKVQNGSDYCEETPKSDGFEYKEPSLKDA